MNLRTASPAPAGPSRDGFTLVELLVVVGIIGLLMGLLLPALNRARMQSSSIKCLSNLRQIGMGLVMYTDTSKGYVVPSYNLPWAPAATTNVTGGPDQILDGWACILDRDGYVKGNKEQNTNTAFYCPDTVDVEGVKDGQTGTDPGKPRGWTDWPLKFTTVGGDSSPKVAVTYPEQGFNKIIRVSYFINAYNPIGSAPASIPANDLYYTGSVGFGPDTSAQKNFIRFHKTSGIRHPTQMVVVSDGVYMGRQSVTQKGMTNSRVGYRHPGPKGPMTAANVVFADGHCETVVTSDFPAQVALTSAYTANGGTTTYAQQKQMNLTIKTVYANPEAAIQAFDAANPGAN